MRDIQLGSTNEVMLSNGNPVSLSGADAVAQAIRHRLHFVRGEWFLDLEEGMDLQRILGKHSRNVAIAEIRRVIAETPGVAAIQSISSDYDSGTRTLRVAWTVSTDYGALTGSSTFGA